MRLQDIFQLLSYVVAIVSSVLAWASKRHSDKTMEKIELTKEEFARENEQLKRQQYLDDEKLRLISSFLGSINEYQSGNSVDFKNDALRSCGQVIPVCSNYQKQLVTKVSDAINNLEYPTSQEEWDKTRKIISEVTVNFYKAEDQLK